MTVLTIGQPGRASVTPARADGRAQTSSGTTQAQGAGATMPSGEDDRARFARLVMPHLADAYSLARWITGNRADAEDVVQDASLRAFRAIWNADANPRAWLLAIVRNTAFTWMRKNRPAALVTVDDAAEIEEAQSAAAARDPSTPETALIARSEAAQLEGAIAQLPTVYREALVLRDIHGLSYREIADVVGVPIGTVMSRLARGRQRVLVRLARSAQSDHGAGPGAGREGSAP
jgi:RNA polymerase sigma-70 factor (ECF subfamily)